MDNQLRRQTVSVIHPVLDKSEEYVLGGDFVLPEYCPDVAVVLKCMVTPYIHNRQWSNGQLLLDGVAAVRVLYLDEERRCVREAEFNHPISCSLRAEDTDETPIVRLFIQQDYVNCRATSPRRLEVRGAFTIHAVADAVGTLDLVSTDKQDGLHLKTTEVALSTPKVSTERVLAVSDVVDFDSSMPPAEQLLGGACYAVVQECKLLVGKAIVKGQVYIHQIYTDDAGNGAVHIIDHTLPFSQIVDLDGAEDSDLCTADVMILSDTQRCTVNGEGQNTALEVSLKLLIQVQVYDTAKVPVVLDGYHSRYPSTLKMQEVSLRSFLGTQRQSVPWQQALELPANDLQEILDVWVQPGALSGKCEDGQAQITGRMHVCMLVRDTNGMVAYYERPETVELAYPASGDTIYASLAPLSVSYTVTGNRLELRVGLGLALSQWLQSEKSIVQDITLRQEEAYTPGRAAIRLYYAQPGERVWDIARECHTSPEGIMQENGLSEDVLHDKRMLVVPIG